jgi:hypothetical protein
VKIDRIFYDVEFAEATVKLGNRNFSKDLGEIDVVESNTSVRSITRASDKSIKISYERPVKAIVIEENETTKLRIHD